MSSTDLAKLLVTDFLKSSWNCVETLVKDLTSFKEREDESKRKDVKLFYFKNGQRNDVTVGGWHYFLRTSVEYSNPQLTVEEVQGIIAARLLEACANHFYTAGLHEPNNRDVDEMCEKLRKPPEGLIIPFLINTDDIEPDRYSMNPLKESIVNSGQSAFPVVTVTTEKLEIDQKFLQKYEGSLICRSDIELVKNYLERYSCYMDMVDAVKYDLLEKFSEIFGIDLNLYAMRMPLTVMKNETSEGLLHHIIREAHKDYASIESVYKCTGRSLKSRTTLLTIPHSPKGYGSKRAAKGKIYLENNALKDVKVDYETTLLYPNAIDPADVSIAKADDHFKVKGEKFVNYSYAETPSSPQFFLYMLASPENAALWHGIGAFGASQLVKSYVTVRSMCNKGLLIRNLETYGVSTRVPLQFNLMPEHMWAHPIHHNIDASIGCVENLNYFAQLGMKVETLPAASFIRE
ncbi:MAG: hypothetical protein QXZ02_01600 [Candidatus Bathyarchaeia archaeon]